MSSNTLKKLERHLHHLNMQGERAEAVQTIQQYLSKNREDDRVLLKLAFFLYHHAIPLLYRNKKTRDKAKKQFEQAIYICKKLIKKDTLIKKKITINARIYLAQMYAILKKPSAIAWARQTYSLCPCFLTANRLADVYARLGHTKHALRWYKRENKFVRTKKDKLAYHSDLALFLYGIKKEKEALRHAQLARLALKSFPKTPEIISMYKILTSSFPQLKRTSR